MLRPVIVAAADRSEGNGLKLQEMPSARRLLHAPAARGLSMDVRRLLGVAGIFWIIACSSGSETGTRRVDASALSSGGAIGAGGSASSDVGGSGGSSVGAGGSNTGSVPATGGTRSNGGASSGGSDNSSGGLTGSGGASAGGSSAKGGAAGSGGASAGGSSAKGGASGVGGSSGGAAGAGGAGGDVSCMIGVAGDCPAGWQCTCRSPNNPSFPPSCFCAKECESAVDCSPPNSNCGCGSDGPKLCVSNCYCFCG
jgi:hypothetical protein